MRLAVCKGLAQERAALRLTCFATISIASLKLLHRVTLALARNSSTRRIPMLYPLQAADQVPQPAPAFCVSLGLLSTRCWLQGCGHLAERTCTAPALVQEKRSAGSCARHRNPARTHICSSCLFTSSKSS